MATKKENNRKESKTTTEKKRTDLVVIPKGKGPGIPSKKKYGTPKKPITRAERVEALTGKSSGFSMHDQSVEATNKVEFVIPDPVLVTKTFDKKRSHASYAEKRKAFNKRPQFDTLLTERQKEVASIWWTGFLPLAVGFVGSGILALGFGVTSFWAAVPAILGVAWLGYRMFK